MALADAAALAVAAAVYLALVWLIYTEFTYLGRPLTRWLYAVAAGTYERKWRSSAYRSETVTEELFLEPLRRALAGGQDVRLLDLACGSGRIGLKVLQQPWFHGAIDAVDLSPSMIRRFDDGAAALGPARRARVTTRVADLGQWQAPPGTRYHAVAFLEASEFMPDLPRLVAEISRALAPGGLLLTTKVGAPQAWLFFGRHQTTAAMTRLLRGHGFERIAVRRWRRRYDVVHAWKA